MDDGRKEQAMRVAQDGVFTLYVVDADQNAEEFEYRCQRGEDYRTAWRALVTEAQTATYGVDGSGGPLYVRGLVDGYGKTVVDCGEHGLPVERADPEVPGIPDGVDAKVAELEEAVELVQEQLADARASLVECISILEAALADARAAHLPIAGQLEAYTIANLNQWIDGQHQVGALADLQWQLQRFVDGEES
jgi:hypothetical protein